MKQTLRLSVKLAGEAVQSKDEIEALAFAMLVKLTFVSSRIQSATISRLKDIFHIGGTRMSRILKNGVKHGFLTRDGADLVVNALYEHDAYHVCLNFECKTWSRSGGCRYKLNEIIDIIRKSVLLNHISKQTECVDTIYKANDPSDLKEYKRASKRCKRMLEASPVAYAGLSNARIMQVTRTRRAKAKKLIRALVGSGLVLMKEVTVKTGITLENFCREANEFLRESGCGGYLFRGADGVYCRLSNVYQYNCNLIRYEK